MANVQDYFQGHNNVFDKKELKKRYEGRVSFWNDKFEKVILYFTKSLTISSIKRYNIYIQNKIATFFKQFKNYDGGEEYEVDDLEKWATEQDNFTDDESGVEFDDEVEGNNHSILDNHEVIIN